jgi:CRP/FNR family transcriptional regulator, cyclic AMP receptor protein
VSTILELCQGLPTQTFAPGTILLTEGTPAGALCILVGGQVEILKGDFQVNTVSDPGAFFGEMSILLGTAHTATVRTLSECRVHLIEDGDAFLRSNKEVAYDFLKVLAQRLQGVTTYLADLNRYMRSM